MCCTVCIIFSCICPPGFTGANWKLTRQDKQHIKCIVVPTQVALSAFLNQLQGSSVQNFALNIFFVIIFIANTPPPGAQETELVPMETVFNSKLVSFEMLEVLVEGVFCAEFAENACAVKGNCFVLLPRDSFVQNFIAILFVSNGFVVQSTPVEL